MQVKFLSIQETIKKVLFLKLKNDFKAMPLSVMLIEYLYTHLVYVNKTDLFAE